MRLFHKFKFLLVITLSLGLMSACVAEPAPTETAPAPTDAPPTAVPTPEPTPTPLVFQPPAGRYLPTAEQVGNDYEAESSLLSENLAANYNLPLPRESLAFASFRNRGFARASDPQNGAYYRMTWWVLLAESEANARLLYAVSQSPDYARNVFLVVMPAAIQERMTQARPLEADKGRCDDAAISSYVSDTYAVYRQSGQVPTMDARLKDIPGGFSVEDVARMPPDIYLYSACRVENAVILFWGHAPYNFDGNYSPIPDEVIAGQVREKMEMVINHLVAE
jgi:hypothetical protein